MDRQPELPGIRARRTIGRAERQLDRALVGARRAQLLLPEHGALVAHARVVAQVLDQAVADGEHKLVPELARELRMALRDLTMTPADTARRTDEAGAALAELLEGLSAPSP